MNSFYDFLVGPALWITFIIFFGGLIIRAAFLFGISRDRDAVFYHHFDVGWSLRSIINWLLPLGSVSWRQQPAFAIIFFVFHVCLIVTPLFLGAHNILWEEAFGWSLPTLPNILADILTVVVIGCAIFLFVRRIIKPEVRIISGLVDYLLLLLVAAPFVTGFLAYHQLGDYQVLLVTHILLSEVLLIIIPFSKLGHLFLFFFTRAFIGSEMGARREIEGRLGARTW